MKFGDYLRTISFLGTVTLIIVVGAIPLLLLACLPVRWRFRFKPFYWIMDKVYWLLTRSLWVPITVVGKGNIPHNTPLILAANHQSSIDIPLIGLLFKGQPHTALVWHELARFPGFGFLLRRMCVIVDTRSPRRAVAAIERGKQLLIDTHMHLMIFPEGGRYNDGTIHDFFLGFAILAKETGRPVVPILLVNVGQVCAPKTIWIHYAPIKVIIGKPFTYLPDESTREFLDRVHAWFVEQNSHGIS